MTTKNMQKAILANWPKVLLKVAISGTIFAIILTNIDLAAFRGVLARSNLLLLAAVVLCAVPMLTFESLRWTQVMKGLTYDLPWVTAAKYSLVAWFFGNLAPGFVGFDAFRIVQMKRLKVPTTVALRSVTLDRLSAFVSMLVVILLFAPKTLFIVNDLAFRWTAIAIVLIGVGAIASLVLIRLFQARVRSIFHNWWFHKIIEQVSDFVTLFTTPRNSFNILASGAMVHVTRAVTVYFIAMALAIDITLVECIALVPISLLISMVPISIGDWGVREAVFVIALANLGLPAEEALAISVCYGLYRLSVGVLGGFAWLAMRREHFAIDYA